MLLFEKKTCTIKLSGNSFLVSCLIKMFCGVIGRAYNRDGPSLQKVSLGSHTGAHQRWTLSYSYLTQVRYLTRHPRIVFVGHV